MATTIGAIEGISGIFYAEDASGNVRVLKAGDSIYQDEKIYGDINNISSNTLEILSNTQETLNLTSTNSLVFDISTNEAIFGNEEVVFSPNPQWLPNNNGEIPNNADETLAQTQVGDITEEETAAGETVASSNDLGANAFDARAGASVNITSDLRDTTFVTTAPFPVNEEEILAVQPIIETSPVIDATPPLTVSLSVDRDVTVGGNILTYTISVEEPAQSDLIVTVEYNGNSHNFTIKEGNTEAKFQLSTTMITLAKDSEYTVEIAITGTNDENMEFSSSPVSSLVTDSTFFYTHESGLNDDKNTSDIVTYIPPTDWKIVEMLTPNEKINYGTVTLNSDGSLTYTLKSDIIHQGNNMIYDPILVESGDYSVLVKQDLIGVIIEDSDGNRQVVYQYFVTTDDKPTISDASLGNTVTEGETISGSFTIDFGADSEKGENSIIVKGGDNGENIGRFENGAWELVYGYVTISEDNKSYTYTAKDGMEGKTEVINFNVYDKDSFTSHKETVAITGSDSTVFTTELSTDNDNILNLLGTDIDFGHTDFDNITNIDEISLNADKAKISLTVQDVLDIASSSNEIKITGAGLDDVILKGDGWSEGVSESGYTVYTGSSGDNTVTVKIQEEIQPIL